MIEKAIQEALVHWQLGEVPVTLIAQRENKVFRVETASGPAALRVHRPGYRTINEIHSELLWMDMLAKNAIPVPRPIHAADGTLIKSLHGYEMDLLSWVEGAPLSKSGPSPEVYHNLGKLLGRMHNLTDRWTVPTGFKRPTWDLVGDNPLWDRFWLNPGLTKSQAKQLFEFRDHARIVLEKIKPLDFGLIHADLVSDNVLVDGKDLWLIDFDDGGFGYYLFDLATITFHSRRDNSDALAKATLTGYAEVRDMNVDALTLFEAMRACTYVGWNITRMEEAGAKQRNVRYIAEAETAITTFYKEISI